MANRRTTGKAACTGFLALWATLWIGLNIAVGICALRAPSLYSLAVFLLVELLNLGVSYSITQVVVALVSSPLWPQRVQSVAVSPKVAILYTTCDDLDAGCLRSLSRLRYPHCQVFVLDDSRDALHHDSVSRAAAEFGFPVLVRESRAGFKAGSLNHWLSRFSNDYAYFVVADADSMLPDEFVEDMLRYAEHPGNAEIAVFQSLLVPWNDGDYLASAATVPFPVVRRRLARLINRYGYLACWGHNALYRTREVVAAGGFDERFSSEDFALAIDLANRGRRCRLVDVTSYERFPRSFHEYARRSSRWARQMVQLVRHKQMGSLPILSCAHLFMDAFGYAMPTLFAGAAILVTWGGRSSLQDLALAGRIVSGREFPIMLGLMVLYAAVLLVDLPEAVLARRIKMSKFFHSMWLRLLLNLYASVPVGCSVVNGLFSRRPTFEPTGRRPARRPTSGVGVSTWGALSAVTSVVLVGVLRNPLSMVYNCFWILPFLSAPIAVLWVERFRIAAGRRCDTL